MLSSVVGEWHGLVVVCAGTPWDGVPMPERHVADRLSAWAPVLYVDPPISATTAWREGRTTRVGLRVLRPGLARLSSIVFPGARRLGMVRVTEALTVLRIRAAIRRLGARPAVRMLASDLPLFDRHSRERRVLFATDDFLAGAALMGLRGAQIRDHEARLARESDLVIAISEPIAAKWRAMGCRAVVVPNGCDVERFAGTDTAPLPTDVRLESPIAGFVGQINDRLDVTLLEAVAADGRSLLLVGPVSRMADRGRFDRLVARPNVQWLGAKPFDEMPSYLRTIHVGLTPYTDTAFNRASVPLKTIEYLAAGRAVVSTDLPATRSLATDHVTIASAPTAFADAVRARLAEPLTDAIASARRTFAAGHSWSTRSRQLAKAIGVPTREEDPCGS
jgi:teichuronic acid biosynthesis glycosyltransferase TuaH